MRDGSDPCGASGRTIVVGLGSPHGDDQIGWKVAEAIADRVGPPIEVRNLTVPIDLAAAIEGFDRVIVIDACRDDEAHLPMHRWEWPSPEIGWIRASGTHAIGLPESLKMIERLGRLPGEVIVWGIPGRCFSAGAELGERLREAIPDFAGEIVDRDLAASPMTR